MKRTLPALLSLSLTLWATAAVSAPGDKRIALVIGNAAYESFGRLANPGNDADDIASVLRRVGFEVVDGRDLSRRDMDRKLAQFSRIAHDADTALVYYAGHGLQYQGQNYLVPTDAQLKDGFDVPFETIAVESVIGALDSAKGARILILDACRDLPLKDTGRRDSANGPGLASVVGRKGLIMAYATQANNVAFDGTGRNSFYAAALIKTMAEPGLEVGQVFQRVAMSVSTATSGRQLPEVTRSFPGEVYLNRDETDIQAWSRLRASNQVAELRNFAAKYAASFLKDDALARIKMLEEQGRAAPLPQVAALEEPRGREERPGALERNGWARLEDEQRQREKANDEKAKLDEEQRQREKARLAADKARRDEEERRQAEQTRLLAQRREEEAREAARQEAARQELARQETARQEAARQEAARQEALRQEAARLEQKRRDEDNARIAAAAEAERREEMARLERSRREEEQRVKLAMLEAPKVESAKVEAAAEIAKAAILPAPADKPAEGPAIAYASLSVKEEVPATTAALDATAPANQDRIVRAVQDRLNALGCYNEKPEASWGRHSMDALERFYRVTQAGDAARPGLTRAVKIVSHMPDQSTLDVLNGYSGRICPVVCPTGTEQKGDACVRVSCPPGLTLEGDECRPVAKPQRASLPAATPRPVEASRPAPEPARKAAAPEPRTKRAALPEPEPVKHAKPPAAKAPVAKPAVKETPRPVREAARPVVKPKVTVVQPIRARAQVPALARPSYAPAPASTTSSYGPAEIGASRMMSRMP
ncbi:peptidase C14 [Methylobacterium variabile]|jgi:hypothetical protein|uniref:Peptidase C14 n=1 Tax=Methylobacterium variabile TaxID=298794 RepID=A0A0J6T4R5_9HYPH|nr:caspase family protein [Methylobacterium variabile]KMO40797.1 peptidase C14 [Methylobacterium variabile]